jgi:DNA-binding cell septation regulator SpoVG
VKAICNLAVEGLFLIQSLRVTDGPARLLISLLRLQGPDGHRSDAVRLLTQEAWAEIKHTVLAAYQKRPYTGHLSFPHAC